MTDQMTRERTTHRDVRPRRRWTLALSVAVVLAVVALGTWAVIEATGTDQTALARDLVDEFLAEANNNDDGEAAAALFTEDGVVDMPDGTSSEGREAITAHVDGWAVTTDDWERVGDVVETGTDTFEFTARGNWLGTRYEGTGEVVLEGDSIAHFTWFGGFNLYE